MTKRIKKTPKASKGVLRLSDMTVEAGTAWTVRDAARQEVGFATTRDLAIEKFLQVVAQAEKTTVAGVTAKLPKKDPERDVHAVIIELVDYLRDEHNLSEPTIRFILEHAIDLTFDKLDCDDICPPGGCAFDR